MIDSYTNYFIGKMTTFTNEMEVLEICKYMGWDYNVFMKQPKWMIDIIKARIIAEDNAQRYIKLKYKN